MKQMAMMALRVGEDMHRQSIADWLVGAGPRIPRMRICCKDTCMPAIQTERFAEVAKIADLAPLRSGR